MKKLVLVALAFFPFLFGQAQNDGTLENGGFEIWLQDTVSENPNDWATSEQQYPGLGTIARTMDAQHGNTALHMKTLLLGSDTAFGYALLGNVGDNGPEQHIAYSDPIDSLVVWMKFSAVGDDSVTVLVSQRDNAMGSPVMEIFRLTGTQNTWTRYAFPLSPVSQDSVLVAFASGNAMSDYAVPGSYLFVDNVSFTSSSGTPSALPNFSFEDWTYGIFEDPENWYSLNAWFSSQPQLPVTKSTDAHAGNFAALVQTLQNGQDTLPGMLLLAPLIPGQQPASIPYIAQPTNFEGAYKYTSSNNDFGFITCAFYDGGVIVDQPMVQLSNTVGTYTTFSIPINLSAAPDSMTFMAMSGDNPGSMLWLDELALTGGDVGYIETPVDSKMQLFPNPARDFSRITLNSEMAEAVDVSIYDMAGKRVATRAIKLMQGENNFMIDTSELAPGTYLISVVGKQFRDARMFVIR